MMKPILNDDNIIIVTFYGYQNEVHVGRNTCSCGTIKKFKQHFFISSTYCGCCTGHFLYHCQNALNVKLKSIKIISSPLNTNYEGSCGFVFKLLN